MQQITMNMNAMVNDLHHDFDCYNFLNSLKIPDLILQNLALFSPALVSRLAKIAKQKTFDPKFAYIDTYRQFYNLVTENSRTLVDNQHKELLKELASIDGRKKFVAQNSHNDAYVLFLNDAIEHSSLEYQDKLKKQLQELEEFIRAIQSQCPPYLLYRPS